ncbi:unnamed protein product [Rotaria magnacalcarata]
MITTETNGTDETIEATDTEETTKTTDTEGATETIGKTKITGTTDTKGTTGTTDTEGTTGTTDTEGTTGTTNTEETLGTTDTDGTAEPTAIAVTGETSRLPNDTTVVITVTEETSRLAIVSTETTEAETSTVANDTTAAIVVSTASTNIHVVTTISYTSIATPTASTSTILTTTTATPTASTSTILTTTTATPKEKPPVTNNNDDLQKDNLRLKLGLGAGLGLGLLATTSLAIGLYNCYNRGVPEEQKNNIGKNNNTKISPENPPGFPSPVPSSLSAMSFISIDELTKLEKSDPVQDAPIVPCIITDQTSSRSDETFIEIYIEEDQVIPIGDIDGETHRILNSMASNVNDQMKSDFDKKRYLRVNSQSPTIHSTTPVSTKHKLFNRVFKNIFQY